jgi:hypothetical protein
MSLNYEQKLRSYTCDDSAKEYSSVQTNNVCDNYFYLLTDVGLSLLVDTLRLTAPGLVIQMCNDKLHQIRHLPMMTPEFLASSSGVVFKQVILL